MPLTSVENMAPFLSEQQKRFALGAAAALLLQAGLEIKKKKRKKRKWWVRPWSSERQRKSQGLANNLVGELRDTDPESFKNFFRLAFDRLA